MSGQRCTTYPNRLTPLFLILVLILVGLVNAANPTADLATRSRARQPSALCVSTDGSRVFVANQRSGSLSVIDTRAERVVAEAAVGQGLSDVAALADGRHLIAVDQERDAVVLIDVGGVVPRVVGTTKVSPDPVSVLVLKSGSRCVAASRGSRRLTFLELNMPSRGEPSITITRELDLPFRPRNLAVLSGEKLVAADAFGGKLALIDGGSGTVTSVVTIPGHNIRGLAVSPDGRFLVVAHQSLERSAPTTLDDVHFGALMRNALLILPVEDVLSARSDRELIEHARVGDLDGFGNGAGDPAGLAFDRDGGVTVALAGVGEVGISASATGQLRRVPAGRRPSAVALRPDGSAVYVADAAEDAVWVVELPVGRRRRRIPLGPRPEPDAVERGERLFHDARLSHDRWLSCQSCHTDGQTNGLTADTLGDGSYGAPKLVLSLLGSGETGPWAWDGSVADLEEQVRKSVETTMRGTPPTDQQVSDLTAYVRSLAPPIVYVTPARGDADHVDRGRAVFLARKCDACHAPPSYTTHGRYDVGLTDEVGNRKSTRPRCEGSGRASRSSTTAARRPWATCSYASNTLKARP